MLVRPCQIVTTPHIGNGCRTTGIGCTPCRCNSLCTWQDVRKPFHQNRDPDASYLNEQSSCSLELGINGSGDHVAGRKLTMRGSFHEDSPERNRVCRLRTERFTDEETFGFWVKETGGWNCKIPYCNLRTGSKRHGHRAVATSGWKCRGTLPASVARTYFGRSVLNLKTR